MSPAVPRVAGLLAVAVLAGCSARVDGPGASIDVSAIPEAQPKDLPKSDSGNPDSYVVRGERYRVRDSAVGYVAEGRASWYGRKFHGRRTSSGERYDMYAMTAAHRTLPLPTFARVTNLENGKSVVVKINDRGPFHQNRLIDLSYAAALRLDIVDTGTARVRVRALTPGAGSPTQAAGQDDNANGGAARGPSRPSPQGGAVYLQIGAFSRFANAQQMRARVQGADIKRVDVEQARGPSGAKIYRVRVGPLQGASQRDTVRRKLERAEIGPVHVVEASGE